MIVSFVHGERRVRSKYGAKRYIPYDNFSDQVEIPSVITSTRRPLRIVRAALQMNDSAASGTRTARRGGRRDPTVASIGRKLDRPMNRGGIRRSASVYLSPRP